MGPGLFWNFPPKAGCTVPQSLLQTMYVGSWSHCYLSIYLHNVPYPLRATQVCPLSDLCGFYLWPFSVPSVPFCQSVQVQCFTCSSQQNNEPEPTNPVHHVVKRVTKQTGRVCRLTKYLFRSQQIVGIQKVGAKPDRGAENVAATSSKRLFQHPFNVFTYIRTERHT